MQYPKYSKAKALHITNIASNLLENNTGKIFKTLGFKKIVPKMTKAQYIKKKIGIF